MKKLFSVLIAAMLLCTIVSCETGGTVVFKIEPKTNDFGTINIGDNATFDFIISNKKSVDMTLTAVTFLTADFAETTGAQGKVITAKSDLLITVQFTPVLPIGSKTDTMHIEWTDLNGKTGNKDVVLDGNAVIAHIQPNQHDFGTLVVGQSATKDFVLTNDTDRDFTVSALGFTGTNPNDFTITAGTPGLVPASGGSIVITVEFSPLTYGNKTANLSATTNDTFYQTIEATVEGNGDLDLIETFDNTSMSDTAQTTAEWGTLTQGVLEPTGLGSFGTGADGDFNPTSNVNLASGVKNYSSINIPQGVTVTVTGTAALEILCFGSVIINGEINLDGKNGMNAPTGTGGAAGPGGGKGGDRGQNGTGAGGGVYTGQCGGGGGFGSAGTNGTRGGTAGVANGNEELNPMLGGSGGAGGDQTGGGGAGGAISILAGGNIEIGGLISANGGMGGGHARPGGSRCYGAGGGSGGGVKLVSASNIQFTGGSISVLGGMGDDGYTSGSSSRYRGGYGGSGRIRLEDRDGQIDGIGGSVYPIPSAAIVATPFTGGTGAAGAFNPTSNQTLDTANSPFYYSSVNIPQGVTITATGTQPLEIYATGNITIAGKIDVSGGNAVTRTGGIGVAGGGNGGNAGYAGASGSNGSGTGGGHGGQDSGWSTSSGGGFGTAGQQGSNRNKFAGGIAYGTPELNPILAGSGGGGGQGYSSSYYGGGGGAGGGALRLQSAATLEISGELLSNGGEGANSSGSLSGAGSGGSGGGILLQGDEVLITGLVSARGNKGGYSTGVSGGYSRDGYEAFCWTSAWGGDGRIRIEAYSGNVGGAIYTTKGKECVPSGAGTNPTLTGTCSISTATVQAGMFAQSKFFNSTIDDPTWATAVVTANSPNQITIQYQGAEDDGAGNPDMGTLTSWEDTLPAVGQTKFVRFRIYFVPGSGNPTVDTIELPFS